jgi:hypothetical protein
METTLSTLGPRWMLSNALALMRGVTSLGSSDNVRDALEYQCENNVYVNLRPSLTSNIIISFALSVANTSSVGKFTSADKMCNDQIKIKIASNKSRYLR